jgi:hypothetical protein
MAILAGLIVSIDAFFIGVSLGLQEKCRFMHLVVINAFLFVLCIFGFLLAGQIYAYIPFSPDIIVGIAFIILGLLTIFQSFLLGGIKRQTVLVIGAIMSGEAMLITIGLTLIFLPHGGLAIPVTVALAHFVYSALTCALSRTKYVRRIPSAISHTVSGLALIAYGIFALL